MFIGHYAVGMAAKRVAPKASLGVLILSAELLDLLWPMFSLLGLEHARFEPGATAMEDTRQSSKPGAGRKWAKGRW
jgi:hypothetical protein